ncbi:MAG: hypothetical protein DRJ43_00815 [Thermoprotei archaeon]|nr:MAG: hypothetical protein DRJ43_00815 [Thermoprotei archaeon]
MPVFVIVGRGRSALVDKVSTIFFPRDFLGLLRIIEERYGLRYPSLKELFNGREIEPLKLLEEVLQLLRFLMKRSSELPRSYFFAVMPKDFSDVASLICGGASSMTIPFGEGTYKLVGGFGRAELYVNEKRVRELREGEELELGTVKVKVFTRPAYNAVAGPLKTLLTAALIASREGLRLKIATSPVNSSTKLR